MDVRAVHFGMALTEICLISLHIAGYFSGYWYVSTKNDPKYSTYHGGTFEVCPCINTEDWEERVYYTHLLHNLGIFGGIAILLAAAAIIVISIGCKKKYVSLAMRTFSGLNFAAGCCILANSSWFYVAFTATFTDMDGNNMYDMAFGYSFYLSTCSGFGFIALASFSCVFKCRLEKTKGMVLHLPMQMHQNRNATLHNTARQQATSGAQLI